MTPPRRHGVARTLSKLGICSRTEAAKRVRAGRVKLNGRVVLDPEHPVVQGRDRLELDGSAVEVERCYVMLNKPRGLVTTVSDEKGRDTVYRCLEDAELPWLAPVGRLDKASEGLLLLCNDPEWAASITDPAVGPDKTYHVQVDTLPDAELLNSMRLGLDAGGGHLHAKAVRLLRAGERNSWLEVVLDEGRNRHIRRLLEAHGVGVLRLVRVAVGGLQLGDVPKGGWRRLDAGEVAGLLPAGR
ncbi:pseudouridine synthase [Novilysobacter spongiicola]|uniref:Dual-specificity RNA pseudouridine synthase RluF n=1 Tax=Lysobacter spongiicola DSM 21749 TaxID=1122188 RepID=A0A1T4S6H2_9GAMM|nr:pseudouridine synthase [Lysobacter spongiicola]SKA23849.1 23S rRNA pseudouridine2605 synthase [Lysobacter spongiicola DSM 21749]